MEAALEDNKPSEDYPSEDSELKVYAPLTRCVKGLKEKYIAIARIHRERFEQVKSMPQHIFSDSLLIECRARRCIGILLLPSRILIHQNRLTPDFK